MNSRPRYIFIDFDNTLFPHHMHNLLSIYSYAFKMADANERWSFLLKTEEILSALHDIVMPQLSQAKLESILQKETITDMLMTMEDSDSVIGVQITKLRVDNPDWFEKIDTLKNNVFWKNAFVANFDGLTKKHFLAPTFADEDYWQNIMAGNCQASVAIVTFSSFGEEIKRFIKKNFNVYPNLAAFLPLTSPRESQEVKSNKFIHVLYSLVNSDVIKAGENEYLDKMVADINEGLSERIRPFADAKQIIDTASLAFLQKIYKILECSYLIDDSIANNHHFSQILIALSTRINQFVDVENLNRVSSCPSMDLKAALGRNHFRAIVTEYLQHTDGHCTKYKGLSVFEEDGYDSGYDSKADAPIGGWDVYSQSVKDTLINEFQLDDHREAFNLQVIKYLRMNASAVTPALFDGKWIPAVSAAISTVIVNFDQRQSRGDIQTLVHNLNLLAGEDFLESSNQCLAGLNHPVLPKP